MQSSVEIAESVRAGQVSAVEIVQSCLDAIDAKNAKVNAFIYLDRESALASAREIDAGVHRGEDPGPLAGVPFGIKDLRDDCRGMPRTDGSLFLKDSPPAAEDTVHIARLKAAGAIPLGKVASAEFGMDGVTHTRAYGTTRNPWDLTRTPGGSSGGSAAAVAAGLAPFCTATDGGGSTRCPAGYTGLAGLKPSHGRIPRSDGSSDRSCLGALTTTVRDTARYLDAVAGPHECDRMTLPPPTIRYEEIIDTLDVAGLRAAWSPDLGYAPVEPDVVEQAEKTAMRLVDAARLTLFSERVQLTNTYLATNMLLTEPFVLFLEAEGILPARIDELSPGPRYFVERSRRLTPTERFDAMQQEKQLLRELGSLFSRIDVLLTPTNSCGAYAAEGPLPEVIAGRDASATHAEPFTMLANLGWNPSISVPAGLTREGLPVGLLITTRRHRDDIALRLARILEEIQPWPRHAPGW